MEFAKKVSLEGKILDVVSPNMYGDGNTIYKNTSSAVEMTGPDGKQYILPVRNQTDDRPGIYDAGMLYFSRFPEGKDAENYLKENLQIIDHNDTSSMSEFLEKQQQLRNIEEEILTDIDSVFVPPLLPNDTAEMRALKEAVIAKQCDINKYQQRFGDNYLNDRRIFKTNKISMGKMISVGDNLDMEIELIIRDKNPNVANPMGIEIHAILTGGNNE